mgnify:CR=1 FL=1
MKAHPVPDIRRHIVEIVLIALGHDHFGQPGRVCSQDFVKAKIQVFITELVPAAEGGAPHLRLYLAPLSGSPTLFGEIEAAADARMFLDDEDPAEFHALCAELAQSLKPADAIEVSCVTTSHPAS